MASFSEAQMFPLMTHAQNDFDRTAANDTVDTNHQPQASASAIKTLEFSFMNKDFRIKLFPSSWYLDKLVYIMTLRRCSKPEIAAIAIHRITQIYQPYQSY